MGALSVDLKGKTAVVTGSTSGIGQGLAEEFAKSGANVMLNGLGDQAQIEKDRAAMAERHGVEVGYDGADMTKPDAIEALIKNTHAKWGSVDIVVNNAGVQHVSPVEEFPVAKWDLIIAINLTSAFHTIRAAVPFMKEKGWGRIINLASAHGLVASPFKSAYVAAKHGMLGLTKTVALEVAKTGVTCNAICPGYVHTPLVDGQIADTAKARGITEKEVVEDVLLAAQPTKKFVTYEELGATALYLCSDGSASTNGAAIAVEGGWTAQ